MTYKEIEDFIKTIGVERRTDLLKASKVVYGLFKSLSEEEQNKLLPAANKLDYISELNTVIDFKKFIIDNNINSRSQLGKKFPTVYIKFKENFTEKEKEEILPSKLKSCKVEQTEKSFMKFLKENNITSRDDFRKRFPTAYNKFLKLSLEERNRLLPKINGKYTSITTKADVLEFIAINNITSRSELYQNYNTIYCKFLKLLTKEEQAEVYPLISYENLNTIDDFSKFIQENNINSRGDFSKRFKSAYEKFMNVLSKGDRDKILPSLVQQDYTGLNTREDFREFIRENNI